MIVKPVLRRALWLLGLIILLPGSAPSRAAGASGPWYVAPGGDDANSCRSPAAPCATINGAVARAVPGDTVYVAGGVYHGSGDEVVRLDRSVMLSGGWDASFGARNEASVIDGLGERIGVTVDPEAAAVLDRFAVQNCLGRGIINAGTLTVVGCDVRNNSGGGIRNSDGALTVTHSRVRDNVRAGSGVGVATDGGTATIDHSHISGNTWVERQVSGIGVAIEVGGRGSLVVRNTTISGNTCEHAFGSVDGLAIGSFGNVTVSIINSTISGNRLGHSVVHARAGGRYEISNSTITSNDGRGLVSEGAEFRLRNTILAGHYFLDCENDPFRRGFVQSLGYNLIGLQYGCTTSATDLLGVDARLLPLQPGGHPRPTHPLAPDSPAFNGGDPAGCRDPLDALLETDQRGLQRFGRCDIGAYELQPLTFSTKTVRPSIASPGDRLAYTIGLANPGPTALADVRVNDTLPISITYETGSLTATGGAFGYGGGTITWTGSIDPRAVVTITFAAELGSTPVYSATVANSAVISGGGEILTRTAAVLLPPAPAFLPVCFRQYCADLFEDFSDPAGGWPIGENDHVRSEYREGEYRILTKQGGYFYLFGAPTCGRAGYTVEADARWVDTPGNSYGLLFGIQSNFSRYYLYDLNSSARVFRLYRRSPSGFAVIVPPTQSYAIRQGTESNHLRATRSGNAITLEVNGTVLGTWYDGQISGLSGVGLVASSSTTMAFSDARFDNFWVVGLPGGAGQAVALTSPEAGGAGGEPLPQEGAW